MKVKHLTDKLKEEEKKQPPPRAISQISARQTSARKERQPSAKKEPSSNQNMFSSHNKNQTGLKTTAKFGGNEDQSDIDFEIALKLHEEDLI